MFCEFAEIISWKQRESNEKIPKENPEKFAEKSRKNEGSQSNRLHIRFIRSAQLIQELGFGILHIYLEFFILLST